MKEEKDKPIPTSIKCPDCNGEGWYYGDDNETQCEKCSGEGKINIKEYAKAWNMSIEDAYYSLKSR